ncbi:MAG: hypothetical protein ACK2U9_06830, partial [Anaerolineae bacterium]
TQSVELLRMFAQDPLVAASREALNILGTVPEAEAAQALQTLTATLPPRQSSLAERMVQKLRLRGVPVPAPPPVPAQGRCLASPIDGQDNQVLWFLVPASDQHGFQGLQILLDGQAGIREAVGTDEVLEEDLPPASPLGKLHNAGTGLQQPIWLEAPFDYGRRRALVALARNWETHRETPLAYRLFNPLLWRWAEPEPEPDPPQPQPVPRDLAGQLLQHPAMAGWFLQSRQIYEAAQRVLLGSDPAEPATVEHLARDSLAASLRSDPELLPQLASALVAMAEWFELAGDSAMAGMAAGTAATLEEESETHPLLVQMAGVGLRVAMINLARGLGLPD